MNGCFHFSFATVRNVVLEKMIATIFPKIILSLQDEDILPFDYEVLVPEYT